MTVLDILASTEIHRFNSVKLLVTNDAYLCITHFYSLLVKRTAW